LHRGLPQLEEKIIRDIQSGSLGIPQKFLRNDVRRGRSLGDKCQLEVIDDSVHHRIVDEESDDAHPALSSRSDQRVRKFVFFITADFHSNSSNSHPLSDFIVYRKYKIKDLPLMQG